MAKKRRTDGYGRRIAEAMERGPRPIGSVRGLARRFEDHGEYKDLRGTSYGGIRQYVEGNITRPRTELLRALADVLEVRYDWLAYGDGEMTEEKEDAQREVTRVAAAVAPLEQLEHIVGAVHDALGVPRWTSRLEAVPAWGPLVLQTAQRLTAARATWNLRATGDMGDYELPEATADVASAVAAPLQALGVNARYDLPDDERDTYVHATTLALQRAIAALSPPLTTEDF